MRLKLSPAISLGLVAATVCVYAQVVGHEFVDHDDLLYFVDNPALDAGWSLDRIIELFTTAQLGNWIPLTWLSIHLNHSLFGPGPTSYLLTNVGLHALTAVLLFHALAHMTGARAPSAFVAAVFALHPLHVESVAWATERKDVLAGVFWALCLWLYSGYARRPSRGRYATVLGSLALALLSKPSAVTLPFVLLLLDYWPLDRLRTNDSQPLPDPTKLRRALVEKLPMLGLVAAVSIATYAIQQSAGAMSEGGTRLPLTMRWGNALESWVVYVKMAIWPVGLAAFYPHPLEQTSLLRAAGAAGLLLAATAAATRVAARRPYWLVGWLWYLGTLVPMIGIVQVGMQARADRYMYIPLIGLALAVAFSVADWARGSAQRQRASAGLAATALAAMSWVSFFQVGTWRDTSTLFEHAVAVVDDSFLAHQRLAITLQKDGRVEEAIHHYSESIRIEPRRAAPHVELASLLARRGDLDGAIRRYRAGLRLAPDHGIAWRALGFALADAQRFEEAQIALERAAALLPESRDLRGMQAAVSNALGDDRGAVGHYRRALRLDPSWIAGANNLAWILATSRDETVRNPDEALSWVEATAQSGTDPTLLDTLAASYAAAGRFDDAIRSAQRALTLARERQQLGLATEIAAHLAAYRRGAPLSQRDP